jgi:hypothetical protein
MKTKDKDTSTLLKELRLLMGHKGLAVYDIHVRKAGYGISYANPVEIDFKTGSPFAVDATVYTYYPTLRKAVIGELKAWKGEGR